MSDSETPMELELEQTSGGPGTSVPPIEPQPPMELEETPQGPRYVFAVGHVVPRFPTLSVEKEAMQVLSRAGGEGMTDGQALRHMLEDRSNRYLARQMCWVFQIEGLDTYILTPRDPLDFELVVGAVRSEPSPDDLDVVVGELGPTSSPEACGGLMVPLLAFDQLYSFRREELLTSIPRSEDEDDERFDATAHELFDRLIQIADNAGATDEHRALNYLAVRYPTIYARTAEAHAENSSLTGVEVKPSRLAGVRTIVDAVFSYTHRVTDVTERNFVRVDVTEEFPFLVTKLSPYYERS